MDTRYRFNRLEVAGSLGDLGTLLPLATGMILINDLDPFGVFCTVGLYYIAAGSYYGVTVPVQPMKVIGAYAIATGMEASRILAAGAWMAVLLLLIGGTGAMAFIGRYIPRAVVRGVQLSTGALLMSQGVKFILGTSNFQQLRGTAEPYLAIQTLGPVPIGIVLGVAAGLLTLFLLENRRFPAGLLVVLAGAAIGLIGGTREGFEALRIDLHLPRLLPFGLPSAGDFTLALLVLVLPQMPMTLGNAVIAYGDLSKQYFGDASRKVTHRSACISMGLANLAVSLFGGMPLCHGAGGLAAHYRFGARTAGSNLIIGGFFLLLALCLGRHALTLLYLIPMAVLGILLLFAGSQLALTLIDVRDRRDLFVVLVMLGITLASNLAVGFLVGIALAHALRSRKLSV